MDNAIAASRAAIRRGSVSAVDEVMQCQIVGATAQISEAYLNTAAGSHTGAVSLSIRGFHSDDNSEYINHLAETKNGAVVRKHMGYGHIAAPHAEAIQRFYEKHFNPYSNFHRSCRVPEEIVNAKGKVK